MVDNLRPRTLAELRMPAPVNLFASAVSDEFQSYREGLVQYLDRPSVRVEEQKRFIHNGFPILTALDDYIQKCDAVIHLLGDRTGGEKNDGIASGENLRLLLERHPDLPVRLQLSEAEVQAISYTQWEALLAIYHGKRLYVAAPTAAATRDQVLSDDTIAKRQLASQELHRQRLKKLARYINIEFESMHHLCLSLYHCLYDLLPPPTNIPIAPQLPASLGSLFKGRAHWLGRIRQAIHSGSNADAVRVVLHGMGGLGKTQLAAEYAYACAHEHSALLIVSGENQELLDDGLSAMCAVLNCPQAVSTDRQTRIKATLDWLGEQENKGWLLIIDNVDDETQFGQIVNTVKGLKRGHILLTSRLDRWGPGFVDLKLDLLDPNSATEYLLDATDGHRISSNTESDHDTDQCLATEIAGNLGHLALGLVQAAGTINSLRLSFGDYIKMWETSREELLDDDDFDPDRLGYPRSVAMTWLTSYQQLPLESKLMFDVLSWFTPEPIPERIFTAPWKDEILALLPAETAEAIRRRQRRALLPLYNFSLADTPVGSMRLFKVHRLVQEVGRIWQRKTESKPVAQRVMLLALQQDFVRPDDLENIRQNIASQLLPVVPHVESVFADAELINGHLINASRLACMLAEVFKAVGRLSDAEHSASHSMKFVQTFEDSDDLTALHALAEAYCIASQTAGLRGKFASAMIWAQSMERICRRRCAIEPDNLAHQRELGIALENVGRVLEKKGEQDQALELFQSSRKISDELCRREPDNLAHQRDLGVALNNVGRVLENKGEQDQALELFQSSRKISDELCRREPDNLAHQRDLGIALENVGRVLQNKGEQDQALELFQSSRKIRDELCRREPDNLAHQRELGFALINVGRVLENKGEQDQALELFQSSRKISDELCRREPDNLAHQRELGIALENVGRVLENKGEQDQALELFQSSREIRDELCRREPDNLAHQRDLGIALNNVGRVLENKGEQDQALELFQSSRKISDELCRREPDNLAHQRELGIATAHCGRVLRGLGKNDEAIERLLEAEAIFDRLSRTASFGDSISNLEYVRYFLSLARQS